MKAEELMIGDWVKFPNSIEKIIDLPYIEGRGICASFAASATLFPVEVDELEPIPLTPEILEKNGFVQNPRSKSRRSHQICTDSVYISWWKGRLNILYKPFIGHSTNHLNCDGKFVHELQHALRLCGIEKEIVL